MAYQYREYYPEELGTVRLEKVKCGKPNCRCAKGKKHKAYYLYYRDYSTDERRLRKKYIPKAEVRKLKRKIQLRKNEESLFIGFNHSNPVVDGLAWMKLKTLPRSKIIEKLHTEIKRAEKKVKSSRVSLLDV